MRQPVLRLGRFGWLHSPAGRAGGRTAVLLCPGLFWDGLQSYHALRLLADAFAAAGYPALRLDYAGTGQSCDLPPGAEPWQHWQRDIDDAAEWLPTLTGCTSLVLCGLRAGATLATLVAQRRPDIAGLILLAPVLRGRSYLRQIQVEAQLESGRGAGPDGTLRFHEHAFPPASLAAIEATELSTLALRPGLPVGLFAQAPSTPLAACLSAWRAGGAIVAEGAFAGLEPMVRQNVQDEGDPADFSAVLAWLTAALPARPAAAPPPPPPAVLHGPRWIEMPLRFGAHEHLFGVLCRPADPVPPSLGVIIVNTGRDPCYGIARFGAECARALAASGIAALRMDFAGLGDSNGPPGAQSVLSPLFEQDRTADLAGAIDALAAHGIHRVILHGLCSGAYHALRAALADSRVQGLLLINLPVFRWRAGDTAAYVEHKLTAPRSYAAKILHAAFWARLLRGEIDVARVLHAQAERLAERLRPNSVGDRAIARQAMAALARRGVRSLLLFSPDDPGLASMEQAFGPGGAQLAQFAGATMAVMPALDHVLSAAPMRQAAIARMRAFLQHALDRTRGQEEDGS